MPREGTVVQTCTTVQTGTDGDIQNQKEMAIL